MAHPITKIVTAMTSVYKVKSAVRNVFYSPKHFPKILVTTMICSCVGGYQMMESIHQRRLEDQDEIYAEAWHNYRDQTERYNEQYETALRPTLLQQRKLTKSASVRFLSRETKNQIKDARDRLTVIQDN